MTLTQEQLNLEMVEMGKARFRRRIDQCRSRGKESDTAYGMRLLSGAIDQIADGLREALGRKGPGGRAVAIELLRDLPPEVSSMLAAQAVLDCISSHKTATRTAISIGRIIEDEIGYRKMCKAEPKLFQDMKKRHRHKSLDWQRANFIRTANSKGVAFRSWTDRQRLHVGHAMLEIIRDTTGLVELVTSKSTGNRTVTYVTCSPTTMKWIEKASRHCEVLTPLKLPMVKKPVPWTMPNGGGYGLLDTIVKTWGKVDLSWARKDEMPEVYEAINILQKVPYQINRRVYEVMVNLWEKGECVAGLPSRERRTIAARPDKAVDEEAYIRWIRQTCEILKENRSRISLRMHYAKLIHLAEKFMESKLWFPLTMDFRGRFYAEPSYLSYQGIDAAQALLQFAHKKPITDRGAKWLASAGAAHFGIKGTFLEKYEWVQKNDGWICKMAQNPLELMDWAKADEPWQFLSFCCEWEAYRRVGPSYESGFMVSFDGSANGLQVLSLAWRDEIGAASTNCLPSAKPRDLYGDVAQRAIEILKRDNTEWARKWLAFGIDRSTTKRPTMVVPYSATKWSCRDYIQEWYDAKIAAGAKRPFRDSMPPMNYLNNVIWQAISEVVVKAREAMEWFKQVSKVLTKNDVRIQWRTPTGFTVIQEYPNYKGAEVRVKFGKSCRRLSILEKCKGINHRRNQNALAPNWVHALDSCALVKFVNLARSKGVSSLRVIHDSYACTPAEADTVFESIRVAWHDLFKDDVVGDLYKQLSYLAPIGVELPPPPEKGSMDLDGLLKAQYFFS